jgi:hypothetical protein
MRQTDRIGLNHASGEGMQVSPAAAVGACAFQISNRCGLTYHNLLRSCPPVFGTTDPSAPTILWKSPVCDVVQEALILLKEEAQMAGLHVSRATESQRGLPASAANIRPFGPLATGVRYDRAK